MIRTLEWSSMGRQQMPPDDYIVHYMFKYIAHPVHRKPQAYPRKPPEPNPQLFGLPPLL